MTKYPKRRDDGTIIFPDYPDFQPNLTPREIFEGGALDGTYFRKIKSCISNKYIEDAHKKYPFLRRIPEGKLTRPLDQADHKLNRFGVHAGAPYELWCEKHWIRHPDDYGWIQWYCEFYSGRRLAEVDEYQVKRWMGVTSRKSGRFLKNLIRQIHDKKTKWNDESISPVIRQTLWHWGYQLTEKDYKQGVRDLLEKRKLNSKKHS